MFRVALTVGYLVSTMEQVQVRVAIHNERRPLRLKEAFYLKRLNVNPKSNGKSMNSFKLPRIWAWGLGI